MNQKQSEMPFRTLAPISRCSVSRYFVTRYFVTLFSNTRVLRIFVTKLLKERRIGRVVLAVA